MYLAYYGLKEVPFSITPDPRFVFLSERHKDALAHLLFGVGQGGSGGFVLLTGEVGTGKTTLSRLLLEQLPERTRVALVLNPRLDPVQLVEAICDELKLDIATVRGDLKGLVDTLNHFLLDAYAQGERVVAIIDEAQNLSIDALEQVRLLTNLETPTHKLLQIILLGQPELRDKLGQAELRQLAQRITARYHLAPLDADDTEAYLRHRIAVAGAPRFPFTRLAVRTIHRRAGGVPRLINTIAERALLAGYVTDAVQINERLAEHAADEVLGQTARRVRWGIGIGVAGALAVAAVVGWRWTQAPPPAPPTPPQPVVATPAELRTPSLADAMDGLGDADQLVAWTHLLALWQVDATRVNVRQAVRCPAWIDAGLACLRAGGNLARLRALDRPVLLVLRDGERAQAALLLGLDGTRARLDLGTREVTVSLAELERHWLGEFNAIWRVPFTVNGTIATGARGPAVAWIRQALQRFGTLASGMGEADVYDADVEDAVRRVQMQFGLLPDGIVGPETLLALSTRDPAGPRLARLAP
jgi:general secretion pathway protein A